MAINFRTSAWVAALLSTTLLLTACEEQEADDLAKAQRCLDSIGGSNYTDAQACLDPIMKYDSQQANIIKCSGKMMSGGLTTTKVATAYKKIAETGGASRAAVFITTLALSPASKASEAQPFCERTGLKGLVYISNLAVMGSLMAEQIDDLGGNGNFDPSDPASFPSAAEINEILADCKPPASCGDNHASIGSSVITISQSYCTGDNATTEVCSNINGAISNSGGDPALVAKQLFCILDNKTYSSGTNSCI